MLSPSLRLMSSILLINYMRQSQDFYSIRLYRSLLPWQSAVEKYYDNFIMTDSGQKLAPFNLPLPSSNPKVVSSPRSPQPLRLSREPRLARTNSQSKPVKRTSTQKYFKAKDIEQELKYSRPHKPEEILQNSLSLSEAVPIINFFPAHLEDSQETVQRPNNYSREKHLRVGLDKGDTTKPFDVLSGMSASKLKKGEDYYAYWKAKAHQYLQANMKLMGQIRKLTSENQRLKEELEKAYRKQVSFQSIRHSERGQAQTQREESLAVELRNTTLHYLAKIQNMQKELKKKEVTIDSYQQQIAHLNTRISGDNERLKLMVRMRQEIQQLQKQIQKDELTSNQNSNSFHTLKIHSPTKTQTHTRFYGSSTELQSPKTTIPSSVHHGVSPRKK